MFTLLDLTCNLYILKSWSWTSKLELYVLLRIEHLIFFGGHFYGIIQFFMWNCCIPIRSDGYVGFASENPFVFTFVMYWLCTAVACVAARYYCVLRLTTSTAWALWFEITFLGSLISALVDVGGNKVSEFLGIAKMLTLQLI